MSDEAAPFRDAEAWLAARGIERDPLVVRPDPAAFDPPEAGAPARTPVSTREALRLAAELPAAVADPATVGAADVPAAPGPGGTDLGDLEDQVAAAVSYVRNATASAPMSEGRVRSRLEQRGHPTVVIERALDRARRERLVDDVALAAALVDERRRRGHAPTRIRDDLRQRGLSDDVIEAALAPLEGEDLEAAAFAVARERAPRMRGVPAETAFRRLAGQLARRGYPEALARKVARLAVFADREDERIAGH